MFKHTTMQYSNYWTKEKKKQEQKNKIYADLTKNETWWALLFFIHIFWPGKRKTKCVWIKNANANEWERNKKKKNMTNNKNKVSMEPLCEICDAEFDETMKNNRKITWIITNIIYNVNSVGTRRREWIKKYNKIRPEYIRKRRNRTYNIYALN